MRRPHLLQATAAVLLLAGCESPASPSADLGQPSLARPPSAIAGLVTGSGRIDLSAWGLPPEV